MGIRKTLPIFVLLMTICAAARPAAAQNVHVRFTAMVGSKPFRCGTPYAHFGRGDATVTAQYFRFYVSNVKLLTVFGKRVPLALQQDGVWQRRDVALLGFEDEGTKCADGSPLKHTEIAGAAPDGRYTGIEFTIGVPEDLDHADATIAQSPLNLSDMFWSWQDGYKFFRFDARVRGADGKGGSYIFHLGSTACAMMNRAATCSSPNRPTIVLAKFDPTKNVVVADLASLFANADLAALASAGGCMSAAGDACQPVMRDLGVAFRGDAAAAQRLFSAQ
jgi:uncharacterized repeat protein (TIGR04052 family)